MAQKVDWNKPLYKVNLIHTTLYSKAEDARLVEHLDLMIKRIDEGNDEEVEYQDFYDKFLFGYNYRILDTIGTYSYYGDTMIYRDILGRGNKYLDGKIIEEWDDYRHSFYKYDSLGSLSAKIEPSNTISYTNTYDKKNRLISIIGTDKKKIFIKYRGNKKIENSRTPKDRYYRIYYYKDSNYQNDTLIITYRPRNCQYKRTEYDSLNRPIRIDYWADNGMFIEKGYNYKTYSYIDNIKICVDFDIDTLWYSGTIYKKEEE